MGFLLRLLFVVLLFFFLRFLYGKLAALLRLPSSGPSPPISGQVHKDPQCGIYVAEELAVKAAAGGRQHHFCSPECRDRFLAKG